jgi:general secretion pathway protein A
MYQSSANLNSLLDKLEKLIDTDYMDVILDYFQLNEHPYRISPDPRFLFFTDQVKLALSKSQYMAQERVGPLYIYGPIGSGKTTILRRLHEQLSQDKKYSLSYIISPNIKTSNSFLRLVLESFNVKTEKSYVQSLKNFENFLIEEYKKERIPLLLVDEAQNMTRDTLKLIHYLLNFETSTTKLLQIVLVGQEELAAKIMRYKELASRMFPLAISGLTGEELRKMIEFRWMVAGGKTMPFDTNPEFYNTLFAYSKGLPRDAVKICDELLRHLASNQQKIAQALDIDTVAKDLNLQK